MARKARQVAKSSVYHILLRSTKQIFLSDRDYFEFENKLKEYFFGDNKLLAYVLLPDRVHLVTYEPPTSSSPTKPLCTSYARYYNRRHASTGRLFYDRFKSVPLETAFDITDTVKFLRQLSGGNLKDEICDKQKLFDVCGTLDFSGYATAMHLEDYQKMSGSELVACILQTTGKTTADLENEDVQNTLFSAEITKRIILPSLNISRTKKSKPNESQPQKKDLSVWLL